MLSPLYFQGYASQLPCTLQPSYYDGCRPALYLNALMKMNKNMASHTSDIFRTFYNPPKKISSFKASFTDKLSSQHGISSGNASLLLSKKTSMKPEEKNNKLKKIDEKQSFKSSNQISNENKPISGVGNKRQHFVSSLSSSNEDISYHQPPPTKKALLAANPISHPPSKYKHGEKLSADIWQNYLDHKQSDELYCKKMMLWNQLYCLLQKYYPYCGLYVVGSTMTGLGSSSSDVDMCLMLSNDEINQQSEVTLILRYISKIIKSKHIKKSLVIPAKVPILNFYDSQSRCSVDLNINNAVGIRNTQLLKCYADCDWRVRPLVLIIKSWAQKHRINDARAHTLSSYSIVLMVIHFLQCGVKPYVLPCLQHLFPNKFFSDSDVRLLSLNESLPIVPSKNKMSLGELLLNFFDYYSNKFNFDSGTVSVRMGCVIPKYLSRYQPSLQNFPSQWNHVCIEGK
ncbi:Poly(A) RNA polymerase gld-2 A [Nymphon striatum]|nr:Poly(A) RNA polymerase gld-2 A [Nymphon striatum]